MDQGHTSAPDSGAVTPASQGASRFDPEAIEREFIGRNSKSVFLTIALLRKQAASMEAALEECLEYFEDRYDVNDGSYGEPEPNTEMRLGTMIQETLYGPGNF